jgi:hypothetical protein
MSEVVWTRFRPGLRRKLSASAPFESRESCKPKAPTRGLGFRIIYNAYNETILLRSCNAKVQDHNSACVRGAPRRDVDGRSCPAVCNQQVHSGRRRCAGIQRVRPSGRLPHQKQEVMNGIKWESARTLIFRRKNTAYNERYCLITYQR